MEFWLTWHIIKINNAFVLVALYLKVDWENSTVLYLWRPKSNARSFLSTQTRQWCTSLWLRPRKIQKSCVSTRRTQLLAYGCRWNEVFWDVSFSWISFFFNQKGQDQVYTEGVEEPHGRSKHLGFIDGYVDEHHHGGVSDTLAGKHDVIRHEITSVF